MSRITVLAAVALLVFVTGLAVGTAGGLVEMGQGPGAEQLDSPTPKVTSIPNTTNYLSVEDPSRRSYVESDVDVVAASGISAERLHVRHANRTFDRRFEGAGSDALDRFDLIQQSVTRVGSRLDAVETRQAALFEAYNNGDISRETFLRRLGRLSARAETASAQLQHVNDRVASSLEVTMPDRLTTRITVLQNRLVTLPDPVTERLRTALVGERDPVTVYAEGAGSDLVLGHVEGGEFVRQATLHTDYARGQPDQFSQTDEQGINLALERGTELYPWAYGNAIGRQTRGFGDSAVYLLSLDHSQGELRSYISGGSRNAFYEIQRQRPAAVPVTGGANATSDTLTLSAETTAPTGPMRVSLTGPSGNTPINGTVEVNGQVVGQTGTNGQLVTVRPSGSVQVNATADNETVRLSLS